MPVIDLNLPPKLRYLYVIIFRQEESANVYGQACLLPTDGSYAPAHYGSSDNAVKGQIWIAISVYVLAAIIKKRLKNRGDSLHYFTALEYHHFRENAVRPALYGGDKMGTKVNNSKPFNLSDDFPSGTSGSFVILVLGK